MDLPLLAQNLGAKDFRSAQFEATTDTALPAATDTSLGEIPCGGDAGVVMIAVTNTGPNPLTALHIGAVPTPNTPVAAGMVFPDVLTSAQLHAGTAIADLLIAVSTDPTVLAAGATAIIVMKANAAWRLQVRATSTLGTTCRLRASIGKS